MAQTTSLVFNGGVIPSPTPVPSGTGKAKLLKIGEITITEQGVQVTKNVICDPDSVTSVAPFMEVITSTKLAELVEANSVLVLNDGSMQYLMADATVAVEDETAVCTSVSFLGLSKEHRAKVTYPCTCVTDELTLQQVIEVGEPVETAFNLVSADSEDDEPGTLIDKLEVVDNVRDPDDPQDPPLLSLETTVDGQGNRKVGINEDNLQHGFRNLVNVVSSVIDTLDSMDFDEVPHGSFGSSLNQSPGDGTTTSIQVSIFRPIETTVGDAIEWTKTTEIGGEDFGTVTLEPGTYIICSDITCQWVGVPAGTYLPQVGNVLGEPFDFSQQQEVHRRMTNVVTVSTTTQFKMRISFDAATPVMGFWINSAQIVKIAGGISQTNVAHDNTLTGKGSVAEPLGVNLQNVAQSTLAGNVAPAFDPNKAGGYKKYQFVVKNGILYRFDTNHVGAWTGTDVHAADLSELSEDKYFIESNGEYAKVLTDSDGNMICAITGDGNYKFFIKVSFVGGVEGFVASDLFSENDNPEYIYQIVDSEGNLICSVTSDGDFKFDCGVPHQIQKFVKSFFTNYSNSNVEIKDSGSTSWTVVGAGCDGAKHDYCSAFGYHVLRNNTGVKNVTIGSDNMENASGNDNTSIGYHSQFRLESGSRNSSHGSESQDDVTGGTENTSAGFCSLQRNNIGDHNVALGAYALQGIYENRFDPNNLKKHSDNVAVGYKAMHNAEHLSEKNVAIGMNTLGTTRKYINCIAIGYGADCDADNKAIIGNSDIVETKVFGDLVVNGTDNIARRIVFNNDGTCSWTTLT